jgi:hypothetical protein
MLESFIIGAESIEARAGTTNCHPNMTTQSRDKSATTDYNLYEGGFEYTTHTSTGFGEHTRRTPPPESADTSEAFLIASAVGGFPVSVSGVLFWNPIHRNIADAIRTLKADGHPIDMATVLSRLAPTEDTALRAIVADSTNMSAMDGDGAAIAFHKEQVKRVAHSRRLNAKQRELNEATVTGDWSRIPALAGELAALAEGVDGGEFGALDARRIRLHPAPIKPKPIFRFMGQDIATPGNLMQIQAQAKAGKSAVVGAMLASLMVNAREDDSPWDTLDTLGFTAPPNLSQKVVLTFDTEQSPFDAWRLIRRTCDRAGVDELPEWVRSYRMNDVATAARRELIAAEMARARREGGGILAVFIDGGADLCIDPNEPGEAFGLVEEWAALATAHNCLIAVVIHENPGGVESAKTRGHLGSQITRKAETNLRLLSGADGITEVYTMPSRSCHIPKGEGQLIKYDAEAGMHVGVHRETTASKADARRAELVDPLEEMFEGVTGGMKWAEFNHAIGRVMGLKGGSVGRMLKEFLALGMVKKDASTCRYCRVTTNYQTTTN